MTRLIDADALVSALNNGRLKEQTGRAVPFNAGVAFALTMVEYAPTIEPKRGEWIDAGKDRIIRWRCSECGRKDRHIYNFCPDCGARMDGDSDE